MAWVCKGGVAHAAEETPNNDGAGEKKCSGDRLYQARGYDEVSRSAHVPSKVIKKQRMPADWDTSSRGPAHGPHLKS